MLPKLTCLAYVLRSYAQRADNATSHSNYANQGGSNPINPTPKRPCTSAQRFQMTKNPPKKITYNDFTNFSNQVSANSLDFRFRSLQVIYFQNVSKCCSHMYTQSISRVFQFNFWRVFVVWNLCAALCLISNQTNFRKIAHLVGTVAHAQSRRYHANIYQSFDFENPLKSGI